MTLPDGSDFGDAERSRLALQERVHGMGWVLMTPEQREAEKEKRDDDA